MTPARKIKSITSADCNPAPHRSAAVSPLLSEQQFRHVLCRERKRSERSKKHFLLMLIDSKYAADGQDSVLLHEAGVVLSQIIRETDVAGWFEEHNVLGAVFNELGEAEPGAAVTTIESKIVVGFQNALSGSKLSKLQFSFFTFPETENDQGHKTSTIPTLFPDLGEMEARKNLSFLGKRMLDIFGSLFFLLVLSPLILILAILIKLTSKGPVLFHQQRVGQFGKPFDFLKFRSMHVSTDTTIHKEYVKDFITGKTKPTNGVDNRKTVYKITNDPRITWIGKIMRRASLDEVPQFWNVLQGEMSLVGPRPAIPYEIEAYDVWHRRRFLEAKPGITGLWQVYGRSRMTFDEMVRLDLQYSRTRSLLLDVKILLLTPYAVLSGDGAH